MIKGSWELGPTLHFIIVEDKGNQDKKLNLADCASRIIAGRPKSARPKEDSRKKMDTGSMIGTEEHSTARSLQSVFSRPLLAHYQRTMQKPIAILNLVPH